MHEKSNSLGPNYINLASSIISRFRAKRDVILSGPEKFSQEFCFHGILIDFELIPGSL